MGLKAGSQWSQEARCQHGVRGRRRRFGGGDGGAARRMSHVACRTSHVCRINTLSDRVTLIELVTLKIPLYTTTHYAIGRNIYSYTGCFGTDI